MSNVQSMLSEFAERARPILERQMERRRELNSLCLDAWENGRLDDSWRAMAREFQDARLHYFVRARGTGDIKIGKSGGIDRRFRTLFHNSSRGADLIACYPDAPDHERVLLDAFRHLRLCGEWHENRDELAGYLSRIGALGGLPDSPPASRRLTAGRRFWR